MTAAADILAEKMVSLRLTDLHGLKDGEVVESIRISLGELSDGRRDCVVACVEAFRSALSAYRSSRINEFAGEKSLVCTCFGVTEERIEEIINEADARSVDVVTSACNAGSGCGSCRMMIQEIIDSRFG